MCPLRLRHRTVNKRLRRFPNVSGSPAVVTNPAARQFLGVNMRPHVYTRSMTTCAIWCRVSKTEQDTANQLDELRQWAQRKGFEITSEYVFEVSASNGGAKHREMLGQALTDARLGHFE